MLVSSILFQLEKPVGGGATLQTVDLRHLLVWVKQKRGPELPNCAVTHTVTHQTCESLVFTHMRVRIWWNMMFLELGAKEKGVFADCKRKFASTLGRFLFFSVVSRQVSFKCAYVTGYMGWSFKLAHFLINIGWSYWAAVIDYRSFNVGN